MPAGFKVWCGGVAWFKVWCGIGLSAEAMVTNGATTQQMIISNAHVLFCHGFGREAQSGDFQRLGAGGLGGFLTQSQITERVNDLP